MATLQISNRTIKLTDIVGGSTNDRTFNLRSVSSVTTDHVLTARPFKWIAIGYTFLALIVAASLAVSDDYRVFGILASIVVGAAMYYLIRKNIAPRDVWILQLEIHGAYSRLLASRDKYAIDRAYSEICAALEADAPFSSTVNIENSTVVTDSNIGGSVINKKEK